MKLFAKRGSRTKPTQVKAVISEADASVLELLKKDPSELNSKQRRMIKRYEDRKNIGNGEAKVSTNEIEKDDVEKMEKETKFIKGDKIVKDGVEKLKEETKSTREDEIEKDNVEQMQKESKYTQESNLEDSEELPRVEDTKQESSDSDHDSDELDEQKVRELLDNLNSKNKRKLTRQLDREGSVSLKSIHAEASRLIQELKASNADEPQDNSKMEQKGSCKSKKRKRSKSVDWSSLPAEERLRREDQRRLQKEAAERRAREGDKPNKKHKHPLNSERRRANRRKPKWSNTSKKQQDYNEHDTSGYHMRRMKN